PSYTYSDGDIILKTSDDVYFRVHSIILKLASGFFRQMLDIPRAETESSDEAIPLTENSKVIAFLLDLVYPTTGTSGEDSNGVARFPRLDTLSFTWAVTNAADKYDMPRALAAVRAIVSNSETLQVAPLGLYALACRWKWVDEARAASTATLSKQILRPENFAILRMIDSGPLCNLLELHAKRKEAIL
ncbi:uncharacterized protein FOMMEDRAFT_53760, partial [Fomitiporia mediterranea MF3/22]|uniref:uncharacterized protein n=1 Tax=Fomitiporia mediterranea (strain MF3/22) TaxID=694068 RepID=UPI0004409813